MWAEFKLDSRYVLTFGYISPRKNHELLIRAMDRISARAPQWSIVIAGKAPEYYDTYGQTLRKVVESSGLQDRVVFTGYLDWDTADKVYSSADIYAHTPEYRISASGTVSTAIGHHLPVLVSDIPVFREIFQHQENGYLVPPRVEPISEGLLKLMNDPTLRVSLREGARELARQLSWEKTTRKTLNVYKSIIEES